MNGDDRDADAGERRSAESLRRWYRETFLSGAKEEL
jgi:hypothetical protein